MDLTLLIKSGDDAGRKINLPADKPTFRIGRAADADFRLSSDPLLSALHFSLEQQEGLYKVRDLGSRFGILINGLKVAESTLHNGDEITAGRTVFSVHIDGQTLHGIPTDTNTSIASATPSPAKTLTALPSVTAAINEDQAKPLNDDIRKVLNHLKQQQGTLFGLFDAAREPSIIGRFNRYNKDEFQCLYDGDKGDDVSAFGPWLVHLPKESPLLEEFLRDGWGKSWGIYILTNRPFAEVRRHFRKFLMAKLPDGREVFFRFYDPRVLRTYLPSCNQTERTEFMASLDKIMVENSDSHELLEFKVQKDDWQKAGLVS